MILLSIRLIFKMKLRNRFLGNKRKKEPIIGSSTGYANIPLMDVNLRQDTIDQNINQRRKLSIIQENLASTNTDSTSNTGESMRYSSSEVPTIMSVSHSRYIVENTAFSSIIILSRSLRIEDTLVAEYSLSESGDSLQSI